MKKVAERLVLLFFVVGISVSLLLLLQDRSAYKNERVKKEKIQDLSNLTSIPSIPTTTINSPLIKEYQDFSNQYHPEVEVIEKGDFSDDR